MELSQIPFENFDKLLSNHLSSVVPEGEINSMHTAVMREEGEVVCFSWIEWPSKAVRDAGMEAVMADMGEADADVMQMPFDGSRMIFGGFMPVVEASA